MQTSDVQPSSELAGRKLLGAASGSERAGRAGEQCGRSLNDWALLRPQA